MFVKILNLLWQLFALGQISIVVNDKIFHKPFGHLVTLPSTATKTTATTTRQYVIVQNVKKIFWPTFENLSALRWRELYLPSRDSFWPSLQTDCFWFQRGSGSNPVIGNFYWTFVYCNMVGFCIIMLCTNCKFNTNRFLMYLPDNKSKTYFADLRRKNIMSNFCRQVSKNSHFTSLALPVFVSICISAQHPTYLQFTTLNGFFVCLSISFFLYSFVCQSAISSCQYSHRKRLCLASRRNKNAKCNKK